MQDRAAHHAAAQSVFQRRRIWINSGAIFSASVFFFLAIALFTVAVMRNFAGRGSAARAAATCEQRTSMVRLIESYQLATGAYPVTLDQLVPVYTPSVPLDGWSRPYRYLVTPGGPGSFDLWSDGPDGVSGTSDDIR